LGGSSEGHRRKWIMSEIKSGWDVLARTKQKAKTPPNPLPCSNCLFLNEGQFDGLEFSDWISFKDSITSLLEELHNPPECCVDSSLKTLYESLEVIEEMIGPWHDGRERFNIESFQMHNILKKWSKLYKVKHSFDYEIPIKYIEKRMVGIFTSYAQGDNTKIGRYILKIMTTCAGIPEKKLWGESTLRQKVSKYRKELKMRLEEFEKMKKRMAIKDGRAFFSSQS
jgi:hypothetical protein